MNTTATDTLTGATVTVDHTDLADAIRPWFPDAPLEVTDAIEHLQTAINRGEPYQEFAAYLALRVS